MNLKSPPYSPAHAEKRPLRPDGVISKIVRRADSWRHKEKHRFVYIHAHVVQELMRHASSRFTLEAYTQAKARAKREAQHRIVEMMIPEEG